MSLNEKFRELDPVKQSRKIFLIYLALGTLWIVLSDMTSSYFLKSDLNSHAAQTVKGLLFILITGLIFYYILKKYLGSMHKVSREYKQSEEKYKTLTENVEFGILRNDKNGRYEYLNRSAWLLLKELIRFNDPSEVIGKFPSEIYTDPVVSSTVTEGNESVLQNGEAVKNKAFFGNKYVSYSKLPETDQSGEIVSVLTLLYDETEIMNNLKRLRASEASLRESVEDKVVMLKEIHHRVKNNLQVVSSLLNMQLEQSHGKEAKEVLNSSRNRIKAMALVHENLYRGEQISITPMSEYVKTLVKNIYSSYGVTFERVKFVYDTGGAEFNIDTVIPLGLIINEALSNSLKHAFPGNRPGEINLRLAKLPAEKGKAEYSLVIKDNGKGLPRGFDHEGSNTLGLTLINALASQLDGSVVFSNTVGTELAIDFKELKYTQRERKAKWY